ncbi:NAD-binding protein, partial [Salmonella enterica subsp. enterica serovar Virginia]|nr:NAD-binding protein [Salmonella enterica subsp. enterica serovar Virginia]
INEIHYLMTTARAEHPVASSAIAEFIQTYKQAREDSDDGIREVLVMGGGIIGLEMGTVYHALGSEIDVVEMFDQVIPAADKDIV